jgi:hypothetical protein
MGTSRFDCLSILEAGLMSTQEAHSGIIELKDVDVSSMERVLLWLYTLDYPYPVNATPSPKATPSQETVPPTLISNPDSNDDVNLDTAQEIIRFQTMSVSTSADLENQETNRLVIHARVYALADRFDIPELRQLTIENFNKFAPYRALDSDDFVAAALEVLRSTPLNDSGLRPIVKRICARYLDSIRTDRVEMRAGRIIDSKSWESIFKEDVDFTWEVMKTAAAMHRADLDAQQPTIDNGLALAKLADIAQRDSCIICRKAFRPLFEVVQSADTPRRVQLRCSHCNQAYRSEEFAEPW